MDAADAKKAEVAKRGMPSPPLLTGRLACTHQAQSLRRQFTMEAGLLADESCTWCQVV